MSRVTDALKLIICYDTSMLDRATGGDFYERGCGIRPSEIRSMQQALPISEAQDELCKASIKWLDQKARTQEESDALDEMIAAREKFDEAHARLKQLEDNCTFL